MPDYYSQHGEDTIAWTLFQDRTGPGYFVEVGALEELEDAHRPVVGRARLGGRVGDQAFGEGFCDGLGANLDHVHVGQEELQALEGIAL